MPETEYKTEFEEFAHFLSTFFQGGRSPEQFTKDMFLAIYLPKEVDHPVEETEDRTYKAYFYGEHDITFLAKKIADSLDPKGFADFVETETDSVIEQICEKFRDYYEDIDASNYGEKTGARFEAIIQTAAKGKRKRKAKTPVLPAPTEGQPLTNFPQNKHGFYLVSEEGSICPNDGCTRTLFVDENGHLGLLFDVVVIDPDESPDDPNNLIALCPQCAAQYKNFPSSVAMHRMKEIKKQFLEQAIDRELLSDQKVQEGVRKVVGKIPKMRPNGPVDLNYNPVMLRKKIEPDNVSLYLKAQGHVNYYFSIVQETMQQMGCEGELRFKPFCEQVKMNYLDLKEKGRDQVTIYRELTDWLQRGTNEERDYCEIVISYFIQKCEVFDVITE
ncbi:MAG: hypothetical protein IJI87_08520 [Mogibacterium sp.]|nr:hypothetical protein [Mogibacterium sp.]